MEASAAPARPAAARGPLGLASPRLLRLASDERLVGHVRAGSQAAYEVIYDRHHRGILSFCRHMLGDAEEAEDAVQHTFMAAYRDLTGSDKPMQLRAWLYAVARNRCLSHLRARRDRPTGELDEPATEGLAAEVERRADLQDMLRDLAGLPEQQRAALVLSELGDLGHDEIGAILGCPRDKVKALVFQARSSLQQSRQARETSCPEIREQLSTLSGGSLRRTELRRHLADCAGCRDFEAEVKRQRRAMAVVLPVVPTLALKESALAAAFSGGAATAGAVGAGGASATAGAVAAGGASAAAGAAGASAVLAKVLAVAAVASGGSLAAHEAVTTDGRPQRSGPPAAERSTVPAAAGGEKSPQGQAEGRPEGSERGRELAGTRGRGRKHGLRGTQPGRGRAADRRAARDERASAREQARAERTRAREQALAERRAATGSRPAGKELAGPQSAAPKPQRPAGEGTRPAQQSAPTEGAGTGATAPPAPAPPSRGGSATAPAPRAPKGKP